MASSASSSPVKQYSMKDCDMRRHDLIDHIESILQTLASLLAVPGVDMLRYRIQVNVLQHRVQDHRATGVGTCHEWEALLHGKTGFEFSPEMSTVFKTFWSVCLPEIQLVSESEEDQLEDSRRTIAASKAITTMEMAEQFISNNPMNPNIPHNAAMLVHTIKTNLQSFLKRKIGSASDWEAFACCEPERVHNKDLAQIADDFKYYFQVMHL